MNLRKWIPGRSSDDTDDRPPKPGPEEKSKSYERTRYEATVEYRNGESETFECYGVYDRGDAYIKFNIDPYPRPRRGEARHSYRRKKIHYETLSREPVVEEVAEDTFTLTWTEDYEWRTPFWGITHSRTPKEWLPSPEGVELEVERDDA